MKIFSSFTYLLLGISLPVYLHASPFFSELPNRTEYQVNPYYEYDAEDMRSLLETSQGFNSHIGISVLEFSEATKDHANFLKKGINKAEEEQKCSLLVALESKPHHWAGIFLRLKNNKRPAKGIFMDPLQGEIPTAYEQLFSTLSISSQTGLMQFEDEDSGPLTIENLLNAASWGISPILITNATSIRKKHIDLLQETAPEFYCKQLHNRHFFEYPWADDKGQHTNRAVMLPTHKSMKERDRTLLKNTIQKLMQFQKQVEDFKHREYTFKYHDIPEPSAKNPFGLSYDIMYDPQTHEFSEGYKRYIFLKKNNEKLVGLATTASAIFQDVDGSYQAPLSDELIYACKPMKFHLIPLQYWTFAKAEERKKVNLLQQVLTEDNGSKSALQAVIDSFKIILKQGKIDENDTNIQAMVPIHRLWKDFFMQKSLERLNEHLQRILEEEYISAQTSAPLEKNIFSEKEKMSILRFLRVAGEFTLQLGDFPFFRNFQDKIYGNDFRQKLSHLRKPKTTLETLLMTPEVDWLAVYEDLKDIHFLISHREELDLDTAHAFPIDKRFDGLLSLHTFLSHSQKVSKERVNRLSKKRREELADLIMPYSPSIKQEINHFNKMKEEINSLKNALFKASKDNKSENLAQFLETFVQSYPETKDILQEAIKDLGRKSHKEVLAIITQVEQSTNPPLSTAAKQEQKENEKLRNSILKALNKTYESNPENRLEEYVTFYRSFHNETEQEFPGDTQFWNDVPSFLEVVFAELRGQSVDTPQSKKKYQLEILNSALDLLEWSRKRLQISDITMDQEIGFFKGNRLPNSQEYFGNEIYDSSSGLRADKAPLTKKILESFLEQDPTYIDVLSFLLRMILEELKTVFYFPFTPDHFLYKWSVRNYYSHPDPTLLSPQIIWNDKGEIHHTGNPIYSRPDRQNGYKKALVNEATSIFGGLYYFLKNYQVSQDT